MELGFSERYLTILNLLLIALLAYFAALSVLDIVGWGFAPGVVTKAHLTAPVPPAVVFRPRGYYDLIPKRDIFNLAPEAPVAAPVAARNLHIKLLGTSHMTLAKPFAIVEDERNGQQALYRLGDTIPDTGRVVRIETGSIVVDLGGQLATVKMDQKPLIPAPIGPPMSIGSPSSNAGGVRRAGANRFLVSRAAVDRNLQNMAQLFTQIRAVPNLQNGRSEGFRLSEIQPDSIFQQIGLRDGDVLLSVNGDQVGDPAKAIQMLASLRESPSISLRVLRKGYPVELHYDIR